MNDATISDCGQYRYTLTRVLDDKEISRVLFVMLNPSTADARVDDPTIRRCIGFARQWGFAHIDVGNLYALRSTDPKGLWTHSDPVGPDNDMWLSRLATHADCVVAAWGGNAKPDRAHAVRHLLRHYGYIYDLGLTAQLMPKHPLYLRADTKREIYETKM